jgi:hypothetical protein
MRKSKQRANAKCVVFIGVSFKYIDYDRYYCHSKGKYKKIIEMVFNERPAFSAEIIHNTVCINTVIICCQIKQQN